MVKSLDCDAELPRNVYEDEIGPDKPLPPPRSRYEPTQVSFFLVKSELAREFSRVLEMVSSANNRDIHYDDIMNRDRSLSALKENMPPHLRIQGDAHDPSYLLMQRFTLDIEYQKTMCKYRSIFQLSTAWTGCISQSRLPQGLHSNPDHASRLQPSIWKSQSPSLKVGGAARLE